jgi:hypothetical protein
MLSKAEERFRTHSRKQARACNSCTVTRSNTSHDISVCILKALAYLNMNDQHSRITLSIDQALLALGSVRLLQIVSASTAAKKL